MKKIIKGLLIAVIIVEVMTYNNIVTAANKSELQNKKEDLNSTISETEDQIEEIQEKKSETLNTVEKLTVQISDYEQEVEEIDDKINDLSKQIEEAKNKIKQDEEEYQKDQEALNQRLVTIYENGNTTYLDYFLSSNSLTDFISSYYLVSELATYDNQMLEKIEQEKNQIEKEKDTLEENKRTLDTAKTSKQVKVNSLQQAKVEKEKYAVNLSEEEKVAQAELEELQKDKAVIDKQLKEIAAKEAAAEAARKAVEENAKKNNSGKSNTSNSGSSGNTSSPSTSGFIFPVKGLSKANIRNKTYPSYTGHTGVDININVTGKSVVAAKAGTVITSTALKYPNGKYRSYGEYIIISHGDGTVTVYAHMLEGSRTVSPGQTVSQGQVIGTVGSTGNSTGTHLHFEVRVRSGNTYKAVNPLPYL